MANNFIDLSRLQLFKSKLESLFAKKNEIPTKVSQLNNDSGYLSTIPSEYVTETELNSKNYQTSQQVSDTVNSAISNLKVPKELTLTTAWSGDDTNGYTQTVSVSGVTSSQSFWFDVKRSGTVAERDALDEQWNKVIDAWTNDGSVTFLAREKTTSTLTILMI